MFIYYGFFPKTLLIMMMIIILFTTVYISNSKDHTESSYIQIDKHIDMDMT